MYLKSYQELIVWQKSMNLATLIFTLTGRFPRSEMFGLTSQMRRASVAIPSNIAEGYGRKSRKEFTQFLSISYGSGLELETQLTLSKRIKLGNSGEIKNALDLLQEILKMLNSMISKLKKGNLNAVR